MIPRIKCLKSFLLVLCANILFVTIYNLITSQSSLGYSEWITRYFVEDSTEVYKDLIDCIRFQRKFQIGEGTPGKISQANLNRICESCPWLWNNDIVTPPQESSANFNTTFPQAFWIASPKLLCSSKPFLDSFQPHIYQYNKYIGFNKTKRHIPKNSILEELVVNRIFSALRNFQLDFRLSGIFIVPLTKSLLKHSEFLHGAKLKRPYLIEFIISEKYIGRSTKGGSSFRIISFSKLVSVCGYRDEENGTYTVYCPMFDLCADVEVQLMHIMYHGFVNRIPYYDKLIWRGIVCREMNSSQPKQLQAKCDYHPSTNDLIPSNNASADLKSSQAESMSYDFLESVSPHGLWMGNRSHHQFVTYDGLKLPVDPIFFCECIRRHTVTLIGASHMKNAYYCMLNTCKKRRVMKNAKCRQAEFANQTLSVLSKELEKNSLKKDLKPEVYVLQTGSWDLNHRPYHEVVGSGPTYFMANISKLFQNMKSANKMLLLVGTPSLPNENVHPLNIVDRSNEITAVFNKKLQELAKKNGIPFLDMMSITYPFYRERYIEYVVPSHHYIDYKCRGVPGMVTIQMMWATVCPDIAHNFKDRTVEREDSMWVKGF